MKLMKALRFLIFILCCTFAFQGSVPAQPGSAPATVVRVLERFPTPAAIPPSLRGRYLTLVQRNQEAFRAAEALGWEPSSQSLLPPSATVAKDPAKAVAPE